MIQLLLVDDDDINNFLLGFLLKKSGFEVELQKFTNPVEALSYLKKCSTDGKQLDLLLLDINMPVMSGWEVLEELRLEQSSALLGTRIFMLSSSVHITDMEQAEKYQEVSGFISKPITVEKLTEIFSEISLSKSE